MRYFKIGFPVLVLLLLSAGGYAYWRHQQLFPSTDNAYIQANVVNIAPRIDGKVIRVYIHDHDYIKKGEPLFDIDPEPYQIAVAKAEAELESTREDIAAATTAIQTARQLIVQREAELTDTAQQTKRILALVKKTYASQAEGDQAIKNLHVAQASLAAAKSQLQETIQKRGRLGNHNAQLRTAEANVAQAELNLEYTHLTAPTSGYIANLSLRQGTTVTAYQPVFALIEDQALWTEANFKETQLSRIQVGQPVKIKIDMYKGRVFQGMVTSIGNDSGASFSLLPPENASGNWVKVTQRFPVKITLVKTDARFPLRLGASCTVIVDTTHQKS